MFLLGIKDFLKIMDLDVLKHRFQAVQPALKILMSVGHQVIITYMAILGLFAPQTTSKMLQT